MTPSQMVLQRLKCFLRPVRALHGASKLSGSALKQHERGHPRRRSPRLLGYIRPCGEEW
jgi:hypothetical protein